MILQIDALDNAGASICLCQWNRWTEDFNIPLTIPIVSTISMVFKRSLINEVGFFHNVRWGGDGEFINRVKNIMGKESIILLEKVLIKARLRQSSLTTSDLSGIFQYSAERKKLKYKPSILRLKYLDYYMNFHLKTKHVKDLKMDFPFESSNLKYIHLAQQSSNVNKTKLSLFLKIDNNLKYDTDSFLNMDVFKREYPEVEIYYLNSNFIEELCNSSKSNFLGNIYLFCSGPVPSLNYLRLILAVHISSCSKHILFRSSDNGIPFVESFDDMSELVAILSQQREMSNFGFQVVTE